MKVRLDLIKNKKQLVVKINDNQVVILPPNDFVTYYADIELKTTFWQRLKELF